MKVFRKKVSPPANLLANAFNTPPVYVFISYSPLPATNAPASAVTLSPGLNFTWRILYASLFSIISLFKRI